MSFDRKSLFAAFGMATLGIACGPLGGQSSEVNQIMTGVAQNQTCGIVRTSEDGKLELNVFAKDESFELLPQDSATSNTLREVGRNLGFVCFDEEPSRDGLVVSSLAFMHVKELSQKCGQTRQVEAGDEQGEHFMIGIMRGRTWIALQAEDGATFNTLSDLAKSGAAACVIADYSSDPGFKVSVKSVAFISPLAD